MTVVRFGCYELDVAAGQLRKRGMRLRLRDQSVQVLTMLVEHRGDVVSRQELCHLLWPNDVDVDFENNLNTAVGRLREVLGDSTSHPRFIETLPRRGYRFIAEVRDDGRPAARIRLLVLPFVNSSGDSSQEYFSDAMTEEVIAELSAFAPSRLAVIARTTAMHYKDTRKDVARIARELSVDFVVEGSTRRTDDGLVALTVQLTRAADQAHVFARRYEEDLHKIFDLQRSVAVTVGEEVAAGTFAAETPRMPAGTTERRKPTTDLAAYNSYILRRHHMDQGDTPQNLKLAREYMEDAIARDPEFALAFDGLADLWWRAGFVGVVPPKEALSVGIVHAMRAVEIDNSVGEAHAMLAQHLKQLAFDWSEVTREMSLAVELNPVSPIVRWRRAVTGLMPLGLLDEAITDLEVALEVDPLAAFARLWLSVMFWLARKYERAIEEARQSIEIAPGNVLAHLALAASSAAAGRFGDAIAAHRKTVELSGGAPLMLGWLGLTLGMSGNREGARELEARLLAFPPGVYVPPTAFAWIQVGLGEIDEFFASMHRAVDMRDHMLGPVKTYPFLDCIRDDDRYVPLLRRMNLA